MPAAIQAITFLVPARYFVSLMQTLFLAGDIWPVVLPNLLALFVMLLFFSMLVSRKSYKRLE